MSLAKYTWPELICLGHWLTQRYPKIEAAWRCPLRRRDSPLRIDDAAQDVHHRRAFTQRPAS
jgi:hypothetical protein